MLNSKIRGARSKASEPGFIPPRRALARRSVGTWEGEGLYFEVWPVRDKMGTGVEYMVEMSFKTENGTTAATK